MPSCSAPVSGARPRPRFARTCCGGHGPPPARCRRTERPHRPLDALAGRRRRPCSPRTPASSRACSSRQRRGPAAPPALRPRAARRARAVVVLKGDDTLVAAPDGRVAVSPGGAPALATAGPAMSSPGFGAYLAKRMEPFTAACAGVFLRARRPAGREHDRRRGRHRERRDRGAALARRGRDADATQPRPLTMPARPPAINLAAIERNVARLRAGSAGDAALCAVVKADGYGHGAVPVARAALAAGAAGWQWPRRARPPSSGLPGSRRPLLVMGALSAEELEMALAARAEVVAWSRSSSPPRSRPPCPRRRPRQTRHRDGAARHARSMRRWRWPSGYRSRGPAASRGRDDPFCHRRR